MGTNEMPREPDSILQTGGIVLLTGALWCGHHFHSALCTLGDETDCLPRHLPHTSQVVTSVLQSSLECAPGNGKHVLYWMRTALRGHENPALDVARAVANQQGLPLVVAAFVLRSHTYPTARRYQFWLQGFCDTQLELREQVSHLPAHLFLHL